MNTASETTEQTSAAAPFEDRILRRRAVLALVGIGRTTLLKLISEGKFPAPVLLSEHAHGWRLSDVQRWISERPRA